MADYLDYSVRTVPSTRHPLAHRLTEGHIRLAYPVGRNSPNFCSKFLISDLIFSTRSPRDGNLPPTAKRRSTVLLPAFARKYWSISLGRSRCSLLSSHQSDALLFTAYATAQVCCMSDSRFLEGFTRPSRHYCSLLWPVVAVNVSIKRPTMPSNGILPGMGLFPQKASAQQSLLQVD